MAVSKIRQNVTLATAANDLEFGTLEEGDVKQDNLVDIPDFSIVAWRFGLGSHQQGYSEVADLNQDGIIDILDITLLAGNFGRRGDTIVPQQ